MCCWSSLGSWPWKQGWFPTLQTQTCLCQMISRTPGLRMDSPSPPHDCVGREQQNSPRVKQMALRIVGRLSFSKRGYNFSAHDIKAVATMEISVVVLQEAENRSISRSSYTTLGHIPKGLCILPQRSLLIHVPCWSILIIGNSLGVTNWWMGNENVGRLHNGISFRC